MSQPADPRRRSFFGGLAGLAGFGVASTLPRTSFAMPSTQEPTASPTPFRWRSGRLHREFFGGTLDPLRFAEVTMTRYGLAGCEYVNSFYKDKIGTPGYLASLKKVASDHGVTSVLIMCDGEGALGDPDEKKRRQAVDNHQRWLEAAKFLGCHSIRVNAQSSGTWDEQLERAADGLAMLSEKAAPFGLNVIVENHGGLSSNGEWLASVMTQGRDDRTAGRFPTSATSASVAASGTTGTRASPS